MTPFALHIKKFGSFIEKQTFNFPTGPGLFFMSGLNGRGKSTVWKACTWVLFGKDPRGLKAGDVANWGDPKGATVVLDFEHEGKFWSVVRKHSPNSWTMLLPEDVIGPDGAGCTIDLVKEEANLVYSMLRLDFTPWLNSVLMAQGEPMFLDLKAEAKAALFSEVMGLDKWVGYSKRASQLADVEDGVLRGLEKDEATLRGRLEKVNLKELDDLKADWEYARNERVRKIEDEHAKLIEASERLKKGAERAADAEAVAQNILKPNVDMRTAQKDRAEKALFKMEEERTALALADAEVKRLEAFVALLEHAKECPTCGAAIDSTSPGLVQARHELNRQRPAARDIYGSLQAAERAYSDANKARNDLDTRAQKAVDEHQAAQRAAQDARREYELNERGLDQLEDEARKITEEQNPYAALHDKTAADAERTRAELLAVSHDIARTTERAAKLGFWVRGFKDIRLQLIAEALEQLAIEVNSEITGLGLDGWELIFEVDRENKGGTISRGFSVYVRSPHNDKPVPWDSWSGGEAQRLRLATQCGLANLIRATTGADIPLEVWDEPTEGLDAPGIDALMESLRARAIQEKRQVWVIDHRALGYGGFDGSVTIDKTDKGTQLKEQTWETK